MIKLQFDRPTSEQLTILCLGAHSDDIEIGCGGLLLRLAQEYPKAAFHWVVVSAGAEREREARQAAQLFVGHQLQSCRVTSFADGFLPYAGADVKRMFENDLKPLAPDLILTHSRRDAHQDHRLIAELTWNTFRNHLIWEYEIPKYDGDLGQPGVFVSLSTEQAEKKVQLLLEAFPSQRSRAWFESRTFLSLLRLRGMECNAPSGYAEAFYGRKLLF